MPAPAHIQSSGLITAASASTNTVLTGVAAGNTLAVIILKGSTGARTWTISDDLNGAWSLAVDTGAGSRDVFIYYKTGVAAGTTTVTVAQSSTFVAHAFVVVEMEPSTLDATGFSVVGSNVTSHVCAPAGSIDTANNVYVLSGGVLNSSGTTLTKNASATLLGSNTTVLAQFRTSDTALTDEQSTWTSSTARTDWCASASFASAASGPTYTLACDAGSFSLAGVDADLLASRLLSIDAASFVLTGIDATLLASRLLTGDVQSYALTGIDAGLVTSRIISADVQSYVLSGVDVALDYSGSSGPTHTIACDSASFALSGVDASFVASRRISPIAASYVFTGRNVNLNYSGAESSSSAFYYYLMLGS